MSLPTEYSSKERSLLWMAAALGIMFVNGAFMYGAIVQPGALRAALTNPVSLAFLAEATLLLCLLTYLLTKWGVTQVSRGNFVLLSLLGSMAFALPFAILWRGPSARNDSN